MRNDHCVATATPGGKVSAGKERKQQTEKKRQTALTPSAVGRMMKRFQGDRRTINKPLGKCVCVCVYHEVDVVVLILEILH